MKALKAAKVNCAGSARLEGATVAGRSNQTYLQRSSLHFTCFSSPTSTSEDTVAERDRKAKPINHYAGYLARLMRARLKLLSTPPPTGDDDFGSVILSPDICDLLILERRASVALLQRAKPMTLPSLLIIRQGIWPINRILVLMRGQATDEATVEWVIRLATLSGSQVTALVVLSSRQQGDCRRSEIADVLARDTAPGRYMRQVLNRMSALNIDCVLRVGQGVPAWQVRNEVTRRLHDLVITSIEPPGRLLDRQLEGLIEPLLQWTATPVLVARLPSIWLEERKR